MTMPNSAPSFSPRLGGHLSIVTSLFVALVLLVLIFDQLGTSAESLRLAMIAGAALTIAAIGLLTITRNDWGYRTADRRVPGAFASLGLTVSLIGATGIASISGSFFFLGFDALPYALGIVIGLLVSAVLVQPYVRKDGALTLSGYAGRRFESKALRLIAGVALSVAMLLMLSGELKLGIAIAASRLGADADLVAALFGVMLALTVVTGGARSLAWTSAAGGMLTLIAIIVPVTLVSVLLTNLPVSQLSYGVIASELARLEATNGIAGRGATATLPAAVPSSPAPLTKPFFQTYGSYGGLGFVLIVMTLAAGIAAHPLIAQRSSTGVSVLSVRRMMAWSAFVAGLILLTLPAIGIFARYLVLAGLPGLTLDQVPAWLDTFAAAGWATYDAQTARLTPDGIAFARDSVLLILPSAAGLPGAFADLALVGLLAAALTAASAHVVALASTIGEDILLAWREDVGAERSRLQLLRGLGLAVAGLGCWMAVSVKADPFELYLWGLTIIGGSMLVPIVMSVWWKRINRWGAMLAVVTGLGLTGAALLLNLSGGLADGGSSAAFVALALSLPAAAAAAVVASLLTPRPEKRMLDVVRDMRVPGGETLLDREMRLARASRKRPV
jgi:cation/acetate symporter